MSPPFHNRPSAHPTAATRTPLGPASWAFWRGPLLRMGLLALLSLFIGLAAGAAWGFAFATAVLLALVLLQVRYLELLHTWLMHPEKHEIPDGWGAWGAVFSDLHRRERREAKNRERLKAVVTRFRLGAEALPDAVVALTPDNRIDWANPLAERWLGVIESRDHGYPVTNLVRAPQVEAYLKGQGEDSVVIESPRVNGLLLALAVIPFDERNRLLIARDVTADRRLDTMRRDFIANISHELKTPLSVVAGFVEHLREMPDMDEATRSRLVALIAEQTERMSRLTHDLLELSRLESDEAPPADELIDMALMVQQLATDGDALSKGQHTFRTSAAAVGLRGGRRELASAFSNLVANAVRYTPAGGTIDIHWRAENSGNVGILTVQDNGVGIAPEHIPRLTERFYRVDASRSRDNLIDGGGTGLGLAIVKHVLLRHGARLDVRSQIGQGSAFEAVFMGERLARE